MDLVELFEQARARLSAETVHYLQATAGPDPDADARAWQQVVLTPRVLQGLTAIDTSITLGGTPFPTPVHVSAMAAHGLYDPDAEVATALAAARTGALYCYSSSATLEVTAFGARCGTPFWAQVYLMTDRARTTDYVARCVAAGASAIVLTVDNPGNIGAAPFRETTASLPVRPGNYPGWDWPTMTAHISPTLTPALIGELAAESGLPVWVKGIADPRDAVVAIDAGAVGIVVSNHGRRQLSGVAPTAVTLPGIVAAVAGRVPVLVDGGIRSGTDVLRALRLGASGVGIGRPVLWALTMGGQDGVRELLEDVDAELRRGMAGMGAGNIEQLQQP